jgi:very-short-patch-repair endonuclease
MKKKETSIDKDLSPVEQIFYNEFYNLMPELVDELQEKYPDKDIVNFGCIQIEHQVSIGIYKVDFLCEEKFIVEIDGYEYHKTKEQRQYDYERERYFQKQGYTVIRFTGTEVYLHTKNCIEDLILIVSKRLLDDEMIEVNYCLRSK